MERSGTKILVKKRKICLSPSRCGSFFLSTFFATKESGQAGKIRGIAAGTMPLDMPARAA